MDARTLRALKGSIKKWEGVVAGEVEDNGSDNCPLCAEFFYGGCDGCPVESDSGYSCGGSPYIDWQAAVSARNYARDSDGNLKATDDETVMCAVLELEYLKSLLPKKPLDNPAKG